MAGIPAVFLDRDGVIIEEVHYLSRVEQVQSIPGAAGAIRKLNEAGVPVVVVTNQSGVARGLFAEPFVAECHRHLAICWVRKGWCRPLLLLASPSCRTSSWRFRADGAIVHGHRLGDRHPRRGAGRRRPKCPGTAVLPIQSLRFDLARELRRELRLETDGRGTIGARRTQRVRLPAENPDEFPAVPVSAKRNTTNFRPGCSAS